MNKKRLGEQVHRILSSGDPTNDSNFDPREIELAVGENADMLMQQYLFRLNNTRQKKKFIVPREFLRKVTVAITDKKGTLSGKNYPLSLPSSRTIYQVRTEDQTVDGCFTKGEEILPITTPDGILSGLESSSLEGSYGYYLDRSDEPRSVEICLMNTGEASITSVSAFVVPSSYLAGRTDELIFPAHLVYDLINMTVKQFAPHLELPHDDKQDNVDV